ncbi:AAA family ATPase [Paramyrothecium foliicola]|nr:AAA family ATPase [Paramyrothecium foliicola]
MAHQLTTATASTHTELIDSLLGSEGEKSSQDLREVSNTSRVAAHRQETEVLPNERLDLDSQSRSSDSSSNPDSEESSQGSRSEDEASGDQETDEDELEEDETDENETDENETDENENREDDISEILISPFWNAITISRDQSQASAFEQEKLSVLQSSNDHIELNSHIALFVEGGRFASSSFGKIQIWDLFNEECCFTINAQSRSASLIAWSLDGSKLAFESENYRIKVWDSRTKKITQTLQGHFGDIRSIAWSLDGSKIASGSADRRVRIWSPLDGNCDLILAKGIFGISAVVWSPDGNQLAFASSEGLIGVWDLATDFCVATITVEFWTGSIAQPISWSSDGTQLAILNDNSLEIWDLATLQCVRSVEFPWGGLHEIGLVAWSPNGSQIAFLTDVAELAYWQLFDRQYTTIGFGNSDINSIAWSPDGMLLAASSPQQGIEVWDMNSNQHWSMPDATIDEFSILAWSPQAFFYFDSEVIPLVRQQKPSIPGLLPSQGLSGPEELGNRPTAFPKANEAPPSRVSESQIRAHSIRMFHQGQENQKAMDSQFSTHPKASTIHNRNMHGHAPASGQSPVDLPPAGASNMNQETLQRMLQRISLLEEENKNLKATPGDSISCKYLVVHKIESDESTYLSAPSWSSDYRNGFGLRGHSPVPELSVYLSHRPEVSFIIEKYYTIRHHKAALDQARAGKTALPEPVSTSETIQLISENMAEAVRAFCDAQENFSKDFPDWDSHKISSPFVFWYHYRNNGAIESLDETSQSLMKALVEWIEINYGTLFSQAEDQMSRGFISSSTMPFFIRPQEVLVSKEESIIQGCVAISWAQQLGQAYEQPKSSRDKPLISEVWRIKSWSYGYDGKFHRKEAFTDFTLKYDDDHPEVQIDTLDIFPIKFSPKSIQQALLRRGDTFWKCRYRNLVAYQETNDEELYGNGERFMIDFATYKQLHSDSVKFRKAYPYLNRKDREELDEGLMDSSTLPPEPHRYIFPTHVVGYNLHLQKWVDLEIDKMKEVRWNTDAFKHLVIDEDTKELIRALISSKLEAEQGTDLIQGKGNGLIILLHGGPGTGKTFTAESVAEIAEKPLYRVTCGDIGTKPEQVEKYLESVLYLGKIWDCVVLLDEADVFLEQRSLTDLERNALVSVFLRVLEYYEGILILTSNRVGTFDEAFKSRIQLSLHYEPLTREQRVTIWRNFLKRLKKLEPDSTEAKAMTAAGNNDSSSLSSQPPPPGHTSSIDFEDIQYSIHELAAEEMNGRQIRNTITTARQLAKFKRVPMSSTHLRHVIKVSGRFEKYLEQVHGNTQEEQVREDGLR